MLGTPISFTNPQGTLQFSGGILGQDWKKLAEQTLARDQKKIDTLKKQIEDQEIQNKALSDLKAKIGALQKVSDTLKGGDGSFATANIFEAKTATILPTQNQTYAVHVTSEAPQGSYTVGVTQIALAYKFRSDAQASKTTALNLAGSLVVATSADGAQNPVSVAVQATDSLENIAAALNNSGSYLSASIISVDETHHYLNISHKQTGQDIYIASTSTTSVVAGLGLGTQELDLSFTVKNETQASRPAILTVDGQTITRPTNTMNDVISGVIFDLYAPTVSDSTLVVERDLAKVKSTIQSFVEAYNGVREFINTHHQVDDQGKPTADAPLYHSELLDFVDMDLDRLINGTAIGGVDVLNTLESVGVTTQYDPFNPKSLDQGKLTIDEAALDSNLLTKLDQIRTLFGFTWTSGNPRLTPLMWPSSLQELPGGMTLDLTMTEGMLTNVQNNKGFTTQIEDNTIAFTSGEATGLVLQYTGTTSVTGVAFTYQTGLFQRLSSLTEGWATFQTGLFDQTTSHNTLDTKATQQELDQAEDRYQTKLQDQIQKYTKMETEYARIKQVLESVQQMSASWFGKS